MRSRSCFSCFAPFGRSVAQLVQRAQAFARALAQLTQAHHGFVTNEHFGNTVARGFLEEEPIRSIGGISSSRAFEFGFRRTARTRQLEARRGEPFEHAKERVEFEHAASPARRKECGLVFKHGLFRALHARDRFEERPVGGNRPEDFRRSQGVPAVRERQEERLRGKHRAVVAKEHRRTAFKPEERLRIGEDPLGGVFRKG